MKKFYLIIALGLFFSVTKAQVQRKVLVEEFSGENCMPCATVNKNYFNNFIKTNASKVTFIKFQVPIPSAGSIYNQTKPFFDANTDRLAQYPGTKFAPYGKVDGKTVGIDPDDGSLNENPILIKQNHIDDRYAISSPYSIDISHLFIKGAVRDSVRVRVAVVNKSGATRITVGEVLRLFMIEKELIFPTPPGTNGETEFHNIARLVIPNKNGITMTTSLANNDSFVITYQLAMPTHLYNVTQVSFVGFVQNTSTLEVLQSGESLALNELDGKDIQLTSNFNPTGYCYKNIKPSITITNNGNQAVNSLELDYLLVAGTDTVRGTHTITKSIEPKDSLVENFANITLFSNVTNSLRIEVKKVDNEKDINVLDNVITRTIRTVDTFTMDTTWNEGFEEAKVYSTSFQTGRSISNFLLNPSIIHKDSFKIITTFLRGQLNLNTNTSNYKVFGDNVGGEGLSEKSIYFPIWFVGQIVRRINPTYAGTNTNFISKKIDYRTNSETSLEFDIAYGEAFKVQDATDVLRIEYSTDCGAKWNLLETYGPETMNTMPFDSVPRTPNADEWKKITLKTKKLDQQKEVMFRFSVDNYFGNGLFIDNIKVIKTYKAYSSILNGENQVNVKVYPNPIVNFLNLDFFSNESTIANISIFNSLGQKVYSSEEKISIGDNQIQINTDYLNNGAYYLSIESEKSGIILNSYKIIK